MKAADGLRPLDIETVLCPQVRASSVIAALVVAPTGQVLGANDCLTGRLGWSVGELVGKNVQDSVLRRAADWTPWATAASRNERVCGVEIELSAADGRTVCLRGDIEPTRSPHGRQWLSGLFVDATAAKHLETSISHASRMEAVASLTSGIAHDFSNLLTVLVGNLYLISEGLRDNTALYDKAKLARDAAKRGIDLVRQLLSFARNEQVRSPTVDLRKVISDLGPLLKRALGSRVTLAVDIAPDASPVSANAAQLESAIVNLVINARDAIEGSGEIRVSVANVSLDSTRAERYGVRPGDFVRIAVEDTGGGIPEQLIGRVFDPFFSTKGEGKGTGLGLPMVRLFAVQSGGAVWLESETGVGTKVTILLPCSFEPADAAVTNTMPLTALPGGNETVFVFAEDDDVRRTVEQILSVLGYRVILGSDLERSIEELRRAAAQLVIVDIKPVSGSPGTKLFQAVRRLRPPPRTVLIRDSIAVHHAGVPTLQKPFDLMTLATTVRRAIDGEYD
jgi:signal transduction histidine kinase